MSTNSKPVVTKTTSKDKTKIVGKFNSKYKDIVKLTEVVKKKK
jgi:hypothetical protein